MSSTMILILGVTASGKGKVAFELAKTLDAEIVSVDSMKVYRRMDIGTAKPPADARGQVPYHLIDVVEPSDSFNVAAYVELANAVVGQIRGRGRPVLAVGGTALYIKALLYGLFEGPAGDQAIRDELARRARLEGLEHLHAELRAVDRRAAERISPKDARRIIRALEVHKLTGKPISSFQTQFDAQEPLHDWTIVGLRRDKAQQSRLSNARVKRMIEAGLVEEVRGLLAEDRPLSQQARQAIGYAEIIDHLQGRISLDEAVELIKKNTRRLAKSQRTWFKTFSGVNWIDIGSEEAPEAIVQRLCALLSV